MAIARRVLKEIRERLGFLSQVGLDYLTLDRPAATLSGGEGQRIRLATQIGSSLVGVLYILDEPSIGLHQRDNGRLLDTLKRLRDLGNTVLVVEHDEETIRAADFVVDLGPGAGELGGHLVAVGTPDEVMANPASLTGRYLSGAQAIETPATRRPSNGKMLTIHNPREHNLVGMNVRIPSARSRRSPASRAPASRPWSTTSCTAPWRRCCTAPRSGPAPTTASRGPSTSTRSSTSISRRSGGPRARTPPRTPASSPDPHAHGAHVGRAGARVPARPVLLQRQGGGARPARATASSRSRCTSCPTST